MGSGVRKDNPPADNNNLIFDGLLSGSFFFTIQRIILFFLSRWEESGRSDGAFCGRLGEGLQCLAESRGLVSVYLGLLLCLVTTLAGWLAGFLCCFVSCL